MMQDFSNIYYPIDELMTHPSQSSVMQKLLNNTSGSNELSLPRNEIKDAGPRVVHNISGAEGNKSNTRSLQTSP